MISFEVLRGVLRCCPLSSFYLDFFFRLAVPMRHVIFLREVGGDWYLQLCKSLLWLCLVSKFFCKIGTVALSFVCDKYCLIMY